MSVSIVILIRFDDLLKRQRHPFFGFFQFIAGKQLDYVGRYFQGLILDIKPSGTDEDVLQSSIYNINCDRKQKSFIHDMNYSYLNITLSKTKLLEVYRR